MSPPEKVVKELDRTVQRMFDCGDLTWITQMTNDPKKWDESKKTLEHFDSRFFPRHFDKNKDGKKALVAAIERIRDKPNVAEQSLLKVNGKRFFKRAGISAVGINFGTKEAVIGKLRCGLLETEDKTTESVVVPDPRIHWWNRFDESMEKTDAAVRNYLLGMRLLPEQGIVVGWSFLPGDGSYAQVLNLPLLLSGNSLGGALALASAKALSEWFQATSE